MFAFHQQPGAALNVSAQNPIGMEFVPDELLGEPTEEVVPNEKVQAAIVADDLNFKTLDETWNEYKVKGLLDPQGDKHDGIISIKITLTKASRSSLYNGYGEPIYSIQTSPVQKFKRI